ncbi:hypothetical protein BQ8420_30945 [Nocardiopsis sp. JB363]|nr:hypothetical protein BQ8420_30945 [Nocardiopsis sp. JB363]
MWVARLPGCGLRGDCGRGDPRGSSPTAAGAARVVFSAASAEVHPVATRH